MMMGYCLQMSYRITIAMVHRDVGTDSNYVLLFSCFIWLMRIEILIFLMVVHVRLMYDGANAY